MQIPRSSVPGVLWPAIPDAPGAGLLALQLQFEQSEWLPPEALRARQLHQLTLVLAHAWEQVPYYREPLLAAGYRPGMPATEELLLRLPILERPAVQANRDALVARRVPKDHGGVYEGSTSGSTGRAVRFLGTGLTGLISRALVLRDHLWHERDFREGIAVIRAGVEDGTHPGWGPAVDNAFASGPLWLLNVGTSVERQLEWIEARRPAYLVTLASNAAALARASLRSGRRIEGLRQVSVHGEAVDPELHALVREAWGAELSDVYSAQEVGYIALQCPQTRCYHVQAENVLLEVLGPDGRACAPGEVGRVVVSALNNFAMPLLRYAIGDYAEVGPPCACGRGLPVLGRIMGRVRNMLVMPDGSRHWPSFPSPKWLAVAPIEQIQLVQRRPDVIEVRYVMPRELTEVESRRLAEVLRGTLRYPGELLPRRVAAIERGAGMKYEDFICLVDAPSDRG